MAEAGYEGATLAAVAAAAGTSIGNLHKLLEFATAHRHELLFLLRHAQGTEYESFFEDLAATLTKVALGYARRAYPEAVFSAASR
ncbi:MAG TPA: hypothetical protein VFU02_14760, partial [Polyangiaceae bacterium]|nr:hypothetical protein [Polyangiaceae bacterium]